MIYCFDFLDIVSYISVIFPKIKSFMIFWFFDNFQLKFMWGECGNQWNSCRIPLIVAISLDFGRKFWVPKHVYQDLMRKKKFFQIFLFWGRSSSLNLSYPKFRSKIINSIVWKNLHKIIHVFAVWTMFWTQSVCV